jgi:acyl carrier protein
MAPQSIEQQIRQFIVEAFLFGQGGENLSARDSLLARGIIDSTGVLEVVAFLERTWDLQVDDEELVPDNFDSIDKLVRFVERKTRKAPAQVGMQA